MYHVFMQYTNEELLFLLKRLEKDLIKAKMLFKNLERGIDQKIKSQNNLVQK